MMNAFVCPECGESNEYDPWTEQAHCQHCGFSPPEGQEMLDYLRAQDEVAEEGRPAEPAATDGTRLTRFLPKDSRSFLAGLAWGAFTFAAIMLLGATLRLPGDAVRCLSLVLPILTTFAVWRWLAWRETRR